MFKNHFVNFLAYHPAKNEYFFAENMGIIPYNYILLDVVNEEKTLLPVVLLFEPLEVPSEATKIKNELQKEFQNLKIEISDSKLNLISRAIQNFTDDINKIAQVYEKDKTFSQIVRSLINYSEKAHFIVNDTYKIYPQVIAYSPLKTIDIWAKYTNIRSYRVVKSAGNIIHIEIASLPDLDPLPHMSPLLQHQTFTSVKYSPDNVKLTPYSAALAAAKNISDKEVEKQKTEKKEKPADVPVSTTSRKKIGVSGSTKNATSTGKAEKSTRRRASASDIPTVTFGTIAAPTSIPTTRQTIVYRAKDTQGGGNSLSCAQRPIIMWKYEDYENEYPPLRDIFTYFEKLQDISTDGISNSVSEPTHKPILFHRKPRNKKIVFVWLDASSKTLKDDYNDSNTEYYFNFGIPVDINVKEIIDFISKQLNKNNCYLIRNFIFTDMVHKHPHRLFVSFYEKYIHTGKIISGVFCNYQNKYINVCDFHTFGILDTKIDGNIDDIIDLKMLNGLLSPTIMTRSKYFDRIPFHVPYSNYNSLPDTFEKNLFVINSKTYTQIKPIYRCAIYNKNNLLNDTDRGVFYDDHEIRSKLIDKFNTKKDKQYHPKKQLDAYIRAYIDGWKKLARSASGDYLIDGPLDSVSLIINEGESECTMERFLHGSWEVINQKKYGAILLGSVLPNVNRILTFEQ